MKKLALTTAIAAALSIGTAIGTASADEDHDRGDDHKYMLYHVTVSNATVNHKLTPPIVIAHNKHFRLFKLGDSNHPASDELAILAETGNPGPLADSLANNPAVSAVATGSELVHGGTPYTFEIMAPKNTLFTVASMLATSNDAFAAAMNIKSPKKNRYAHKMAMTYDAGSEINNENCDFIPGPPCSGDTNMNAAGEGYVTVHPGIYGKADLMPAKLDWRGPTAMVTIHNAGRH